MTSHGVGTASLIWLGTQVQPSPGSALWHELLCSALAQLHSIHVADLNTLFWSALIDRGLCQSLGEIAYDHRLKMITEGCLHAAQGASVASPHTSTSRCLWLSMASTGTLMTWGPSTSCRSALSWTLPLEASRTGVLHQHSRTNTMQAQACTKWK